MLTALLLTLTLLLAGLLVWQQWRTQRLLRELEAKVPALEISPAAPTPPALITVEILNPMELAQRESRLAQAFGSLAPALIRRRVYDIVAQRLTEQIRAQGVEADIRVRHG